MDHTGTTRNATTPPTIAVAVSNVSNVAVDAGQARREAERVTRGRGDGAASSSVSDVGSSTAGVGSGAGAFSGSQWDD